jgi:hypothetical protein
MKNIRDFLGNELSVDNYVVASGKGNTSCEYGMILYKVVGFSDKGKLQLRRLTKEYGQKGSPDKVGSRKVSIANPGYYMKVTPSHDIQDLFDCAVSGALQPDEIKMVFSWLHGDNTWFEGLSG